VALAPLRLCTGQPLLTRASHASHAGPSIQTEVGANPWAMLKDLPGAPLHSCTHTHTHVRARAHTHMAALEHANGGACLVRAACSPAR
jgi:hypothetical protein